MTGTVIATTASGSSYVLTIEPTGVRWYRVPAAGSQAPAAVGWQATLPRIVPGERLMLGTLRSTPVARLALLPGPESPGIPDRAHPGTGSHQLGLSATS